MTSGGAPFRPDDRFFKRLNYPKHIVWDTDEQRWRVSSAVFRRRRTAGAFVSSVDRERLMPLAAERRLRDVISPGAGIGVLLKQDADAAEGRIEHTPVEDDDPARRNPAHCDLFVPTRRLTQRLAECVDVIEWPEEMPEIVS